MSEHSSWTEQNMGRCDERETAGPSGDHTARKPVRIHTLILPNSYNY